MVGLDKRLLYLLGVVAGGVGAYLVYRWYEEGRRTGISIEKPTRTETTPMGANVVIQRVSENTSVITYTSQSGFQFTVTVPAGSEEQVIQELERNEIYYRKMLKEKPWYGTQPVPPEYAEYGGVSPRLLERAPSVL